MKLPKKITPDNLLDTVVELRMKIQLQLELVAGMLAPRLKDMGYRFVSIPNVNLQFSQGSQIAIEIQKQISTFPILFVKDSIRVFVAQDRISFNCDKGKYPGWNVFSAEICKVIKAVIDSEIIESFNRVSVRYVSEYPNNSILENIKYNIISSNELQLQPQEIKLRSQVGDMKVFISLSDNVMRRNPDSTQYTASLFDVNIYENMDPSLDIDVVTKKLEEIHTAEKLNFFGLLKEEFINSRNPEY